MQDNSVVPFILQSSWKDQVEAMILLKSHSCLAFPFLALLPSFPQISSEALPRRVTCTGIPTSGSRSREPNLRQDMSLLKIPDLVTPW